MKKAILTTITVVALTANAQTTMNKFEKQADEIIAQMTLEEKFSQLMNETPGIPRLGIEPYDWWNEGLHGVGRDGRATVCQAGVQAEKVKEYRDGNATVRRSDPDPCCPKKRKPRSSYHIHLQVRFCF